MISQPDQAAIDIASFQPSMDEMRTDPHRYYDALRSLSPVIYAPAADCWIVTGYDQVTAVLKDWRAFAVLPAPARLELSPVILLAIDPPDHTRLRQLVGRGLTADSVESLRAAVTAIVDRLVEAMFSVTDGDIVADLAHPLPVAVIGQLLGISGDRIDDLTVWSDAINDVMSFQTIGRPDSEAPEAYRLVEEFAAFLRAEIASHRGVSAGAGDLISRFVAATAQGTLTEVELISLIVFLMFAGHITTESVIATACAVLAESGELQDRVASDPEVMKRFVDEMLRLHPPLHRAVRVTTKDVTIGDAAVPAGAKVISYLAAANRDPAYFARPHVLDLARAPRRHLTFGAGIHVCLGSFLGRLQAEVAITRMLARGRISPVPGRPGVPKLRPGPYGFDSLPVRYLAGPGGSAGRP